MGSNKRERGSTGKPSLASSPKTITLGSSAVDNTATLNAALLAYGWVIVAKPGTYTFETSILMPSNSRLTIGEGVTLKSSNTSRTWLIRNYGTNGNTNTWLTGNSNIIIEGGGTLDFNFQVTATGAIGSINTGAGGSLDNWCFFGVFFVNCDNVKVFGISMIGSDYLAATAYGKYLICFNSCTNFEVSYCKLNNTSDGIHLQGACTNFTSRDCWGWTDDDFIGITPVNGTSYASYEIAGYAGEISGVRIYNPRQMGHGGAVLAYGATVGGVEYPVVDTIIDGAFSKPVAVPSNNVPSTSATISFGGCRGIEIRNTTGWVNRSNSVVYGKTDETLSTTILASTGVVITNTIKRDQETSNPATSESTVTMGRVISCANYFAARDITIDGWTCLRNNGAEGSLFNNSGAVIHLVTTVATGVGGSTVITPGYITNLKIINGKTKAVTYTHTEASASLATNGILFTFGTGMCYNPASSTYTGTVTIDKTTTEGVQYLAIGTDNATQTVRYHIINNNFTNLDRGIKFQQAGVASFSNNHYGGTTSRIIELASANASGTVDVRFDSSNWGMNAATQLYYSTALSADLSPNKIWLYTLKSCWRPRGRGIQSIDSNRYGPWDGDVFRLTANAAHTLRLRQVAPGDVITIRNDSASGTITLSTVVDGAALSQNATDATQRNGTFTNTAGTALTNPMTTGQVVTLMATSERDWQQIG